MPHFVIDCSENVIVLKSPNEIMQNVYDSAESTHRPSQLLKFANCDESTNDCGSAMNEIMLSMR